MSCYRDMREELVNKKQKLQNHIISSMLQKSNIIDQDMNILENIHYVEGLLITRNARVKIQECTEPLVLRDKNLELSPIRYDLIMKVVYTLLIREKTVHKAELLLDQINEGTYWKIVWTVIDGLHVNKEEGLDEQIV